MDLKELRKIYNISQNEVSKIANIPIRTYRRYEQNDSYGSSLKREKLIQTILNHFLVDEEHGFLTIERIKEQVIQMPITKKGDIDYVFIEKYVSNLKEDCILHCCQKVFLH